MAKTLLTLALSVVLTLAVLTPPVSGSQLPWDVPVDVLDLGGLSDGPTSLAAVLGAADGDLAWPEGLATPDASVAAALELLPDDHLFTVDHLSDAALGDVLARAPMQSLDRPPLRRSVLAMNGLAVVVDHYMDATGMDAVVSVLPIADTVELADHIHIAHLTVLDRGDQTEVSVTTASGAVHSLVMESDATPCKDLCNEFSAGNALLGTVTCSLFGIVGTPAAGIVCGVIWVGIGVASHNLCESHHGAAHIGCEPTGRGAVLMVPECDLSTCTLDMVLRDKNKNLHTQTGSVNIWWAMDGTFSNFSWTQHTYFLDRLDAGNIFDNNATYQGRRKTFTGGPPVFVQCTTAVRIMVSWSGGPNLSRDALKAGTGSAGCTYRAMLPWRADVLT